MRGSIALTRPSWQEIYGGRLPDTLPPVPRNSTPHVPHPECPRDCNGRHGVDATMACVSCQTVAYVDGWHEYTVNPGVNFHQLRAVNGAPALMSADMPCPVCGNRFRK